MGPSQGVCYLARLHSLLADRCRGSKRQKRLAATRSTFANLFCKTIIPATRMTLVLSLYGMRVGARRRTLAHVDFRGTGRNRKRYRRLQSLAYPSARPRALMSNRCTKSKQGVNACAYRCEE